MALRGDYPQIRSFKPNGSDVRWFGESGIVNGLKYGSTRPGGDGPMSCTLNADPATRSPAIDPGRYAEIYVGASRVWWGQLSEPVQIQTGWNITAIGSGQLGTNFRDVWSTWNLNDGINRAITRGLPWINPGVGSGYIASSTQVDSGSQTITDFLGTVISSPPQTWYVDRASTLKVTGIPSTVTRLLVATTAPTRTLNADVNTIFLKYVISDNAKGKTTYGVAVVSNAALIAAHGPQEDFFDITSQGVLTLSAAQSIGNDLLSRYIRAPFASPFTVSYGQYLNFGGSPVDLASEQAGEVVRLLVVDSPYGGEVTMGPIQFYVGSIQIDIDAQNATVTPFMSYRTDLASILSLIQAQRAK